jgi:hypothetical protein
LTVLLYYSIISTPPPTANNAMNRNGVLHKRGEEEDGGENKNNLGVVSKSRNRAAHTDSRSSIRIKFTPAKTQVSLLNSKKRMD